MISILINRNSKKRVEQFTVKGHAYSDEPGKDIVCSAVSMLTQTVLLGLHDVVKLNISYEIDNGYLLCRLPASLNDKELNDSMILIDTMLLGLKNIQESYPKYVKIHDKEV